jgi:hypothetical protein
MMTLCLSRKESENFKLRKKITIMLEKKPSSNEEFETKMYRNFLIEEITILK